MRAVVVVGSRVAHPEYFFPYIPFKHTLPDIQYFLAKSSPRGPGVSHCGYVRGYTVADLGFRVLRGRTHGPYHDANLVRKNFRAFRHGSRYYVPGLPNIKLKP